MDHISITGMLQGLFLAVLLVLPAGCSTDRVPQAGHQSQNNTGVQTADRPALPTAVPPIDRERPAVFETASFGLG